MVVSFRTAAATLRSRRAFWPVVGRAVDGARTGAFRDRAAAAGILFVGFFERAMTFSGARRVPRRSLPVVARRSLLTLSGRHRVVGSTRCRA
jgi:hypothetical protein